MKRAAAFVVAVLMAGCVGEFELHPQLVKRRDPCTGEVESKYIYLYPECAYPPPPPPPEGAVKDPPSLIPGR